MSRFLLLCLLVVSGLIAPATSETPPPSVAATQLAGFAMTHAAWLIQEGGSPVDTIAFLERGKERKVKRFPGDIVKGVQKAHKYLQQDKWAERWVLVWDGFLKVDGAYKDALLAQAGGRDTASFWVALAYEPKPYHLLRHLRASPGKGLIQSVTTKGGRKHDGPQGDAKLAKAVTEGMKLHPKYAGLPFKAEGH